MSVNTRYKEYTVNNLRDHLLLIINDWFVVVVLTVCVNTTCRKGSTVKLY